VLTLRRAVSVYARVSLLAQAYMYASLLIFGV